MTQTLAPAKLSPIDKRIDFIKTVTKPVNDRALAMLAAKQVGMDVPDLTEDEFSNIALKMAQGDTLGRTERWKNACRWASIEIGTMKLEGKLDASLARWAVVQGSVWMAHATD